MRNIFFTETNFHENTGKFVRETILYRPSNAAPEGKLPTLMDSTIKLKVFSIFLHNSSKCKDSPEEIIDRIIKNSKFITLYVLFGS